MVKIYVTLPVFSFLSVQSRRIKCIHSVAQPSALLIPKCFHHPDKLCDHDGLWFAGRQWAYLYSSARASPIEHHRLGAHTTELTFSQSWRLEIQDPGASKFPSEASSPGLWEPSSVCSRGLFVSLRRELWSLFLLQGHQSFRFGAPPS